MNTRNKFHHIIQKSINEAFDFSAADIQTTDISDLDLTANIAVSKYNMSLDIKGILYALFKCSLPPGVKQKVDWNGIYGYVHSNHDDLDMNLVQKEKIRRNGFWIYEAPAFVTKDRGYHPYLQELTQPYSESLLLANFKLMTNVACSEILTINKNAVPDQVFKAVNTIIEQLTGKPYDSKTDMYSDKVTNMVYKMYLSPDNGIIILDHASLFDNNMRPFNTLYKDICCKGHIEFRKYVELKQKLVAYFKPMVIFTGAVGYKLNNIDYKAAKKTQDTAKKTMQFIKAITRRLGIFPPADSLDSPQLYEYDASPKFDKNGHIFWTAVNQDTPYFCYSNPGGKAPNLRNSKPLDFKVMVPDQALIHGMHKLDYVKCFNNPKVIGFKNKEYNEQICYIFNDLDLAVKLLGEEHRNYIENACKRYYVYDGDVWHVYAVSWLTDAGMKAYEAFLDKKISLAEIKGNKNPLV